MWKGQPSKQHSEEEEEDGEGGGQKWPVTQEPPRSLCAERSCGVHGTGLLLPGLFSLKDAHVIRTEKQKLRKVGASPLEGLVRRPRPWWGSGDRAEKQGLGPEEQASLFSAFLGLQLRRPRKGKAVKDRCPRLDSQPEMSEPAPGRVEPQATSPNPPPRRRWDILRESM